MNGVRLAFVGKSTFTVLGPEQKKKWEAKQREIYGANETKAKCEL